MNPMLTKAYLAGAAIAQYRIVKFGSDDNHVVVGAAATDLLIGVSNIVEADAAEDPVDVIHAGIAYLKLGSGGITRGALITSDSTGQGVAPAPSAGTNNYVIGYALKSGSAGDIIPVLVVPHRIQG